jgi:predicted RNase H-like nuclease
VALLAVGVDGARRGLVAAAAGEGSTRTAFFADIGELAEWRAGQAGGREAPVAVDIPIGLPEEVGFRDCDSEARALLGSRRSSVFSPPGRFLLEALPAQPLYPRVQQLVAARGGRGLSRQAAGLLPRIADVDRFLQADPSRAAWLFEVHPELCFREMNDGALPPPKGTAAGLLRRLALIRRPFPDAPERIEHDRAGRRAGLTDLLDAYAALWTALRRRAGRARSIGAGDDPVTGVPMCMTI